jgi:hypothetical protein
MRKFVLTGLSLILIMGSFLGGKEITIQRISEKRDLPEDFCTAFKEGDILVSDGGHLILIGGTSRSLQSILNYPAADALGCIVGFVPAGKNLTGDLIAGAPMVRIGEERHDIRYDSVHPVSEKEGEETAVVEATASFEGKNASRAQITTRYRVVSGSGAIEIRSNIKNSGKSPIEDLDFSLYFNAVHRYSFSPFHRERHANLDFRVYPKKGHFLGFLNQNPSDTGDAPVPGTLAPGESYEFRSLLLTRVDGNGLLQAIYDLLDVPTENVTIDFESEERDLTEVIVRDALSRTMFFRTFLERPVSLEIPLPPGYYSVTANFFPAVEEDLFFVETGRENRLILEDPPYGTLKVKIQHSDGQYVPGKVTFIGLDPTKSPYFTPENPINSGRGWETFKNSCFPEEGGMEIRIPVGIYLVYASRGPEYTMETKIVEIFADEAKELVFRIDKVIDAENLISVDPHMHTIYSDGRMDIAERIRSVVAEGVDVAIATDHNYINDYKPTLRELGLNRYLATIVGNEVTRGGVIHFNTYPLQQKKAEPNNGAINPQRETATPLFQDSRKNDPRALIQVNHPRSGTLGYFNNFALDPESASTADQELDLDFDVLEIMNGPFFYSSNEQAITDWFNLMNRGYFFPIVASSDSHTIDGGHPGYSRTYVYYDGKKGDELDVSSLIQAMKKGRSFATNGPLVDFKIDGTHVPGDFFTAQDGNADIQITVQSAPWISVSEVRLIVNGKRKIIFPVEPSADAVIKFSGKISVPLEKDCYIAAEVFGKRSLFPVHQARAWSGLRRNATIPYAVTNPIFIDVDGNGRFDPPLPKTIHRLEPRER